MGLRFDGSLPRVTRNVKQLAARYGWTEREKLMVLMEACSTEGTHDAMELQGRLYTDKSPYVATVCFLERKFGKGEVMTNELRRWLNRG